MLTFNNGDAQVLRRFRVIIWMPLLVFLFSCSSSKDIVVNVSSTPGLSREMGQSFWTTNPIDVDSSTATYARQLGLETYIVTQFLHRPWEQQYQKWKQGKADSASFAIILQRFMKEPIFTGSLPPLDNESRFFFGRRKNGEYVIVADENNNNSFLDDTLRSIEPAIGKIKNNHPAATASVYITNLKAYDNNGIFSFSTRLELQPSVTAIDTSRPRNVDFYLNILSSETYTGSFRNKGKTYKVATRNCGFPVYNNRPEFELLKFANGNEDSAFLKRWNTRPEYRVGDTVAFGKKAFLIKDASSLNTSVTLKPLRISSRKVRAKQIDPRMAAIAANAEQK